MRFLGDIEAEQTERGRTFRNDPLIGSVALSVSYERDNHVDDNHIDDLGAPFVDHS